MFESWRTWVEEKLFWLDNKINFTKFQLEVGIQIAKDAAKGYTNTIKTLLDAKIDSVSDNANSNVIELFNQITSLKANVGALYGASISFATNYANALHSQAKGYANSLFNSLSSTVSTLYNQAIGHINNNINAVYNHISNLIPDDLKDVLRIVRLARCILQCFIQNPVKCIISILQLFFIAWVQYRIAYAFGTQDAVLPDEPPINVRIC